MSPRYRTTRQKACYECSKAKAKCDRKAPICSRCAKRNSICSFPDLSCTVTTQQVPEFSTVQTLAEQQLPSPPENFEPNTAQSLESIRDHPCSGTNGVNGSIAISTGPSTATNDTPRLPQGGIQDLDFSGLDLVCPIDAQSISNRWLYPYVATMGQKIKTYPTNTTAFIYRMLKSYTSVVIRGRGVPPFIHPIQLQEYSISPALFDCLTLVRTCDESDPGSHAVIIDLLNREMDKIFSLRETYHETTLLAAFQACLLYSMILCFELGQESTSVLRQAMLNLQELASFACGAGIVCTAEQHQNRPRWEAWIVAEAKRRTVYSMYMFDSMLSAREGLPTFLGAELQGLQAPACGTLWHARTRRHWTDVYNVHLADWSSGSLCIDELWPLPADSDEHVVAKRRRRVDRWLEHADEYGTMIFAVTATTHGC